MPFARDAGIVDDAYGVLRLGRGASAAEVRAAWRRVARETHPDLGGDAAAFRTARDAYETLIDPARRAAHDRLLDAHAATDGPPSGPGPSRPGPPSAEPHERLHPHVRVPRWLLLVADAAVVLRAIDVLRGGHVLPPWPGTFIVPLPEGGVHLWVVSMNLLGVPWVFLVVAGLATALLVVELVHERTVGAALLEARPRAVVRALQVALPVPLLLGVTLAAAVLVVQVVLGLLIAAVLLVGMRLAIVVLTER